MIKCIISDLGNVLVHNHEMRICKKLAKYSKLSPEEIFKEYFGGSKLHYHTTLSLGTISVKDFYKHSIKKAKAKKLSQKPFVKIYEAIFTPNKPCQKLMKQLLKKNYALVLLSNTNTIQHNYIRKKFPIMKSFKHQVVSYKLHSKKPGLKIYREAVKKSGCKPEECIYIDDIKKYADAAKKIGIHGLHYTTTAKLKKDLKRLGVKL